MPSYAIESKLLFNKDPFCVPVTIQDTSAATAANYGVFFTASFPCEVMAASESHKTAGSDGGAVTVNLEKLTTGQALDAGITLLSTAFNLKGTASTPVHVPSSSYLFVVSTARELARGDRLALKDVGTMTAVAQVNVTCFLKPLGKGHYGVATTTLA